MATTGKILLLEDDRSEASSLARVLKAEGCKVTVSHRGDEGLELAKEKEFDLVLTDLRMPGVDGLAVLRQLHEFKPRMPIVLMTAFGTTDIAIEATKHGAFDYLVKPFEMEQLVEVVGKGLDNARLIRGLVVLGEGPAANGDAIIGNSRKMQEIYKEIGRIAAKPVTVLIRGETGTGKELVARAIYQHSDRTDNAFIAVNCAAIPETLLESELFGHERGAFTGAETRRIGRFEQAGGGTLFLDEIGDMTPFTQSKLLRVLQDKCIQRIGGKESIPVDVRVIAATHCNLEQAIEEHKFREDLYYRLSGVVIELPPLRERREDIPDLVKYFLKRFVDEFQLAPAGIKPEALDWLRQQDWPGNVRQLGNVVRQAMLLARDFPVGLDHVQSVGVRTGAAASKAGQTLGDLIDEYLIEARDGAQEPVHARLIATVERELFQRAIDFVEGNQARASRLLGVSRQTMRERLATYGIKVSDTASEK
jgi:nitrogen regulation protein NR(I)